MVCKYYILVKTGHEYGVCLGGTSRYSSPVPYNLVVYFTDCLCLRCFKCNSKMSWEDCNQHISQVECKEEDMICFMAHRILTVHGQLKHLFIKNCFFPESCSAEFCRQTERINVNSSWCETKCCDDEDYCNEGVTPSWERAYGATPIKEPTRLCFLTALLVVFVFTAGLSWM